ncbi:hypothetical protein DVA86_29045 [Streptomyces armeniacus]|uniref:Secreted protein n=1 Tax=Streptomyces armeniacus TaxID=83291 RepID=A0A345XWN4_9ACTN|nr:hypothetical protein [Streptomyces armeniacus]AXK36050.1 hypothetical protein DVA86_29045 [Streptomyces armeniacus]
MRRSLLSAGAWTAATGVAVTLSWFAVHTMLAGTAYDPPRALPVSDSSPSSSASDGATPRSSSTHRPKPPSASGPSSRKAETPARSSDAPGSGSDSGSRTPRDRQTRTESPSPPPTREGNVRSYSTEGGRVVFDLGEHSADLVSATPNPGWNMQVWKGDAWIRVTFSTSSDSTSVFCTWNGTPPKVERYDG